MSAAFLHRLTNGAKFPWCKVKACSDAGFFYAAGLPFRAELLGCSHPEVLKPERATANLRNGHTL